jgi:hypothetical protein
LYLPKLSLVASLLLTFVPCVFSQQASISPSALTFAPQVVSVAGPSSPAQSVTLTNTGSADLVVSSVQASGGYHQTSNCSILSPNASCTISVRFNPGTIGPMNGAITITDNAPSSPQVVSLSGTAIAPAKLSAGTLSFGTVAVGTTSQPQTLTLAAAPKASVSIDQIAASGNFTQVNNCPSNLAGGHSCTISVAFHPTASAAVQGALAVSTSVNGNLHFAYSAALIGSGSGNVIPHVSVQPAVINFGNKGPDLVDNVQDVTVTNTSTSKSLTIQNVSLAGSPNAIGAFPLYSITSNTCSGLLAPGAQCQIQVAFSTSNSRLFPESYPAAITIVDTDPTSPRVIGISGNQNGQLTFSPPTLVFPPQTVGTTTTKTVTVTGNDIQNGLVLDISTSGDFAEAGNLLPCFLTQGGSCTMSVSFTPTQKGVITGSITIETYPECNPFPLHHCSDPVILNLSGTGK